MASTSPICGCRRSPTCANASRAENLQELAINANLPVIAIRTPKVGELSRKERDDIKPMFHAKGGARVYRRLQAHRQQVSGCGGRDREEDRRWRKAI